MRSSVMSFATYLPASSRHAAVFIELDRWRIVLALAVVAMHAQALGFLPWADARWTGRLAHDAVVGFFVVSGYSVMHAASGAQWQSHAFLVGRWSRLYSLVGPALVLTLCLDALGRTLRPDLYPLWMYAKWPLHLGFHGLFLGETWTYSYPAFSNVPYWSLGYEAWYYLLLAAWLMPPRIRAGCIALVLVCMGPRVLLLLPCWWMGVLTWRWVERGQLPVWLGRVSARQALLGPSLLLLVLYAIWTVSPWAQSLRAATESLSLHISAQWGPEMRLSYSRWFVADWITAAVFAGAILVIAARPIAAQPITPSVAQPQAQGRVQALTRWLAFHSFGIYLLHYPLLVLAAACGLAGRDAGTGWLVVLGVLAICIGLSAACARTRPLWQRLLTWRIVR
jgi:peptidoglycan/LPS O-acetylase OafA/YrhL